jgi:hypothetical protein
VARNFPWHPEYHIDFPRFIDCDFELGQSGLERIAVVDRNLVLAGGVNDKPILDVQRRDAGSILLAEAII